MLKDNIEMVRLKDELKDKVTDFSNKVQDLELIYTRLLKTRSVLGNILTSSGIMIRTLGDLS
jgi:hypothetical protein